MVDLYVGARMQMFKERLGVLFFSRGRGRGHAVPDSTIAKQIAKSAHDFEIVFVSYGTGARTLSELGHSVIDLNLPEQNPMWETAMLAASLIFSAQPSMVIAHEEFAVPRAARLFKKPCIFITDWFIEPDHERMASLKFADHVFFIDDAECYPEPSYLRGKVTYTGPALRHFSYLLSNHQAAKVDLGLDPSTVLITVLPGSGYPEMKHPVASLIIQAFDAIKEDNCVLIWVAGSDLSIVSEIARDYSKVIVKESEWSIDRLMAATDVAITKGTRQTAFELALFGTPSIALTRGLNPIDDKRVSMLSNFVSLNADHITARSLSETIQWLLTRRRLEGCQPAIGLQANGRLAVVAAQILTKMRCLTHTAG